MTPHSTGAGPRSLRSYITDADQQPTKQLDRTTARRILSYARPYRGRILILLGLVALNAALGASLPLIFKHIIDDGISGGQRSLIIWLAVLAGIVTLASSVTTVSERLVSSRIGGDIIVDMRTEVYDHVQAMPLAFFSASRTGALVQRLSSDVVGAQQALTSTLTTIVSNMLTVTFTLAAMFTMSWQLTLLALALLPVFIFTARAVGPRLARITRERYSINADLSQLMNERFNVSGAHLAKTYGQPARDSENYRGQALRVRDIGVKSTLYNSLFRVSLTSMSGIALVLAYGFGSFFVLSAALTVGTLVAFTAYLGRLYGPLTSLANIQVDVLTAVVSFERVFEVLDLEPGVVEPKAPADIERAIAVQGASLDIDGISFTYPTTATATVSSLADPHAIKSTARPTPALQDVSLRIEPGQTVAIVGPSGSGKSTLSHLLTRMYDPDRGAIRLAGVDLRDIAGADLRQHIGIVTQDAHLFHDTIAANLRYAKPDATDAELLQALADAHILPLVESLPDGLDTVVGDRGFRMSGGERQRLAIARLLLRDPDIVILDEATAHLDSHSEVAVQRALNSVLANRTCVVIAHRLSTIKDADIIVTVQDSRIVEVGTHEDLLADDALYATLYREQLGTHHLAA